MELAAAVATTAVANENEERRMVLLKFYLRLLVSVPTSVYMIIDFVWETHPIGLTHSLNDMVSGKGDLRTIMKRFITTQY